MGACAPFVLQIFWQENGLVTQSQLAHGNHYAAHFFCRLPEWLNQKYFEAFSYVLRVNSLSKRDVFKKDKSKKDVCPGHLSIWKSPH